MPRFPQLKNDVKTDVLIIGGGICGILTAYFLKQNGIDYILVEKDNICGGTTQNTTAKITLQHGLIYQKLLKSRGREIAQGYYLANQLAVQKFKELCADIDCDFEVKNNFVYSLDDAYMLDREMQALDKIGCKAKFVKHLPLPIKTAGAVCVEEQAQFHPLKFISHIAKELNIFENTKVLELFGNEAKTKNGKITAKRIVVATHFPFINKHGSYFLKLYQHRSYVLALENAADVGGMYIDEADDGKSFRNYKNLLFLGGASHRTGKKSGAWSELEAFCKKAYPDASVKYAWAAQDCMSLDCAAYVGKYSQSVKNLFVASGFNKWGMSGAMVAATILSDMLLGKKNKFTSVFEPSRSILKPQLILNGVETITNFVYPTTKRCPHLGCALKWNKNEHSWDCTCHGSRFSKNGELLDGPATDDLKE